MMAKTYCACELMFADDVFLLRLRGARSPPTERRRSFIPQLIPLHDAFAARGYADVDTFVLECASVFYRGSPDNADRLAFLLRTPVRPRPRPTETIEKKETEERGIPPAAR
jgi:hypothetical protein